MKKAAVLFLLGTIWFCAGIAFAVPTDRPSSIKSPRPVQLQSLDWQQLDGGIAGIVYALAKDSLGNLYAGGSFTYTGNGETLLNNIAKWDGSQWVALGSGLSGPVYSLAIDSKDTLYAGGSFARTGRGGIWLNHIAKWHGSQWSAIGSGLNGFVKALAIDSSDTLYAGGTFNYTENGNILNHIAKWDGSHSQWVALGSESLGSGLNGDVYSLAIDSSDTLYAGGYFTSTGNGITLNNIAKSTKWNRSQWVALGSGLKGPVNTLAIDSSGKLYAGGYFTYTEGGITLNNIAKFDGQWRPLGNGSIVGLSGSVRSLAMDRERNLLYVGGGFVQTKSGILVNNIAKWDGSQWSALASGSNVGLNDNVLALSTDTSNNLYVGGSFTASGVTTLNRITWRGNH